VPQTYERSIQLYGYVYPQLPLIDYWSEMVNPSNPLVMGRYWLN
jgi:hypothetical protein